MIINSLSSVLVGSSVTENYPKRQNSSAQATTFVDKVEISQAARDLFRNEKLETLSTNEPGFQGHKGSIEHINYLVSTDTKFAELLQKESRTSSELEYMSMLTGLPNELEHLNSKELLMYDELVEGGNFDAALGLRHIGAIRSGTLLGPELRYEPAETTINSDNIRDYFSGSTNDTSGVTQKHFDALVSYLESKAEP